jgi:prepilin-type N-terminal cleavage/methylation domain-containing protein
VSARSTARRRSADEGFTLVELLVAMGLFAVLGTLLLGLALSSSEVTEQTRARTGVNEESRIAMERMARELRQASAIDSVTLPGTEGAAELTSISFWTDFNGDGARTLDAADPEVLTYRWNPDTKRLTLFASDLGPTEARPVLSANVTSFRIGLQSSRWEYDANSDGVTTWRELDQAGTPVGNANGVADMPELAYVDLVAVTMTVQDGTGSQTYSTRIDLRNRN